jgi:two-component system, NarL family, nitrate/nitrite response regulator NarL
MAAKTVSQESVSPPNGTRIGILIASEIRLLGEGLACALAHEPYLHVCGYCAELANAVAQAAHLKPDVVLLNTTLQTGRELIARMRATVPEVRVVALAIAEEPENVIGWAEAGAAGYVPNTAALRHLAPLLADIMRGEQPCSARVVASLLERLHTVARGRDGHTLDATRPLPTARELQILEMIGDGLSNKEIARHLNIGLATTKSHVHNLLGKLGVQRRSQAASWIHGRNVGPGLLPRSQASTRPRV